MRVDLTQLESGLQGSLSPEAARRWCRDRWRAAGRSWRAAIGLAPPESVEAVTALALFIVASDAVGSAAADPDKSLLHRWNAEVEAAQSGTPSFPALLVLQAEFERRDLPNTVLPAVLAVVKREHDVKRYNLWSALQGAYLSAGGAIVKTVIGLCGDRIEPVTRSLCDELGAAALLTRRWRRVGRDLRDRDLLVIPSELHDIEDFEVRLMRSGKLGHGCDQAFLGEFRVVLKECVERTWTLLERGEALVRHCTQSRSLLWYLTAVTERALQQVELWNYETALHEPALSAWRCGHLAWTARRAPLRSTAIASSAQSPAASQTEKA